ncbi:N4-gp56 family major capsid protein [uncultured Marinobacter sp.]|uniref:N4-gp56 family major capsid protein n=1 Tax=uncultured Marinobacter sp. TaxID=187379 RepID=UPI002593C309|nr:N4-gp56 family major capsid protein [uncultured Marinobacter sp.]
MSRQYNDPVNGAPSGIGKQLRTDHYIKRALIEMRKEQYFGQLADVTAMPKHMGKTLRKYHYLPLLDDANINDQGIDANGATIENGNLYGSSKDVGTITGKMPVLSETGGRVNRVGFKRKEIEGTIAKFGFFDEYTQESLDFDTDADLMMHVNREMLNGANEITEDLLQIDLLNAAGVVKFGGTATDDAEVDATSEVTYDDLLRLSIDLDNNRTPKQTKIITGTRLVDTKTLPGGRVMYIGSELQPLLEGMKDLHGERAFISVEKYAAGGTVLNGEIGTVGKFRIVVVPEMMKWAGAGAAVLDNTTHFATGGKFDVFPMLVVGDSSFSTIGFQTDGKTVKFKITHKKPGTETADRSDPYGETGFMSIKWYYGFLLERPERIGLVKTAAPM